MRLNAGVAARCFTFIAVAIEGIPIVLLPVVPMEESRRQGKREKSTEVRMKVARIIGMRSRLGAIVAKSAWRIKLLKN